MRLSRKFRFLTFLLAIVLGGHLMTVTPSPVQAGDFTSTAPIIASGSTNGIWIVGGLAFSVASIIACAMIVGAQEGREMTLEEALLSGAIPLGCLLREELGVTPQ